MVGKGCSLEENVLSVSFIYSTEGGGLTHVGPVLKKGFQHKMLSFLAICGMTVARRVCKIKSASDSQATYDWNARV